MQQVSLLSEHDLHFPPIEQALSDPEGLLAVGGDLSPERLMRAYAEGIFPWFEAGGPILWWSPDPRMALVPTDIHVSRSLRRLLKRGAFRVTMDRDFAAVIEQCAALREYREGTWITQDMKSAYKVLYEQRHAHSVEVWRDDELVGGLYGVALGPLFFGESMFNRCDNASKIALVALARQLGAWHFRLIDCQMPTAHLASMGARYISRSAFKRILLRYRDEPGRSGPWTFELDPQRLR